MICPTVWHFVLPISFSFHTRAFLLSPVAMQGTSIKRIANPRSSTEAWMAPAILTFGASPQSRRRLQQIDLFP